MCLCARAQFRACRSRADIAGVARAPLSEQALAEEASNGSSSASTSAAAATSSHFTARLAALSVFPLIEAIELRGATPDGASPPIDHALRASLLNMLIAMLERLPPGALANEPADVLDAFAKYADCSSASSSAFVTLVLSQNGRHGRTTPRHIERCACRRSRRSDRLGR